MPTVVGIKFKNSCKVYHFDPAETGVVKGDGAVVETVRGIEYGDVVIGPKEISEDKVVSPLKPVIRKATEADLLKMEENKIRAKEAFNICLKKIEKHQLSMNLVDVEFTLDVGKIIFYFTAEGRVDFRELVKDLAAIFRTRIELRQIGVRDEARMLGGIGYCGRPLCCATFLGDYIPVSIRMAKNQNLSLNPQKISGVCGRLLCCLKYEDDDYEEENNQNQHKEQTAPPKIGSIVATSMGNGRVLAINRHDRTVQVQLAPQNIVDVDWDEIMDPGEVTNG